MQDKFGNFTGGYIAGIATGGSATTLQDTTKNFSNDMLIGKVVVFDIKGIQYVRTITDNDGNTLTFASAHAAEAATCKIQVGDSVITVTVATAGEAGRAYLAKVIEGSGDDALAAALSGQVLTVSLGMTGGMPDDTENTATLVAAAIDGLDEFTASVTTGDGADVVGVTPSGEYYKFTGGLDAMPAGTEYQIQQPEGALVQLAGSNTRESFSSTITIGTGAAHAANDVVSTDAGAIMEFDLTSLLAAGASGVIYSIIATLDQAAVFSGGMGYEIYLYNVSPTAQATNAVFDQDDASLPGYIGKVSVPTLVDEGANCVAESFGYNIDFSLAAADTSIYAKAKCLGGETTIDGAILTFKLGIGTL